MSQVDVAPESSRSSAATVTAGATEQQPEASARQTQEESTELTRLVESASESITDCCEVVNQALTCAGDHLAIHLLELYRLLNVLMAKLSLLGEDNEPVEVEVVGEDSITPSPSSSPSPTQAGPREDIIAFAVPVVGAVVAQPAAAVECSPIPETTVEITVPTAVAAVAVAPVQQVVVEPTAPLVGAQESENVKQ